jgi:formylglycine-generating enzyme required for sulfatase activity
MLKTWFLLIVWQLDAEEAVDSVPVMEDTEMNDSKSKSFTTYTETAAGVSFKMVAIPGGTFSMGSNDGESS